MNQCHKQSLSAGICWISNASRGRCIFKGSEKCGVAKCEDVLTATHMFWAMLLKSWPWESNIFLLQWISRAVGNLSPACLKNRVCAHWVSLGSSPWMHPAETEMWLAPTPQALIYQPEAVPICSWERPSAEMWNKGWIYLSVPQQRALCILSATSPSRGEEVHRQDWCAPLPRKPMGTESPTVLAASGNLCHLIPSLQVSWGKNKKLKEIYQFHWNWLKFSISTSFLGCSLFYPVHSQTSSQSPAGS